MSGNRHKWVKLREHTYICRVCGCGRVNALVSGGWQSTFHLPDGSSKVLRKRPACEVGPRTDAYLGKYWQAIELLTAHQDRVRAAVVAEAPEEMPVQTCPRCEHEQYDFDGFGFVRCGSCWYCSHPSRINGMCELCGDDDDPGA